MSASTVSITGNPSTATRRRHVEKKSADVIDFSSDPNNNFTGAASPAADKITVGGDASIRTEGPVSSRDAVVQARKPLPGSTTTARRTTAAAAATTTRKPTSKVLKPLWMTVISVLSKNLLLLLVLLGLVQIVRQLMLKNGATPAVDLVPGDYKGNMEKVEEFMRSTAKSMKMMQVQVDVLDRKIGDEIGSVKRDVGEQIEAKSLQLEAKLKELDGRTLNFESFMGDLRARMGEWLSKEELNEFIEELKKTNKNGDAVTLDEVRAFARGVVEREIEKHAADGIGRVDYALGTVGGLVLRHSETWAGASGWLSPLSKVHPDAQKMLIPSFGEPGQCFPLKGSNGFVQIKLRAPIIPEGVTLEHVAASVAYDRSSAPKDCRVSGWLENGVTSESALTGERMVLLTEFTYDLEKHNTQTFDVVDSAHSSIINLIRFEFASNHGNPNHTCIYRLRVHGREPHSVLMSKMQP
ncbi:OLC1v1001112C1 [Oldenlandia corymbosa var. corymbosa]|uniref:OLC1v1001112C1 n=1 Tax=Oldenlandia corymbosa var. corymbosa TaxID=529605 RepID=A0AAV1D4I4_OLDCO|nr:OLC1v1001112C1 [Oldenlandia corymbosa var. corymbosa]